MIYKLSTTKKVLFLGGSGTIGKYFKKKIKGNIEFTSKRNLKNFLFFDLFKAKIKTILNKKNYTHVILAINLKNIEQFNEHLLFKKINFKLNENLKILKKYNIKPIFLSSDYVYPDNPKKKIEIKFPKPSTKYGKHKIYIERFIQKNFKNFLILRLGKVIHDGKKCFAKDWKNKIIKNKNIKVAKDQIINPIHINDFVKILYFFLKFEKKGIYNISNSQNVSRKEILKIFKKIYNKSYKNYELFTLDRLSNSTNRPKNTSMDTSKLQKIINFKMLSIKKIIKNLR